MALSDSLFHLDLSNCGVCTIAPLAVLRNLQTLLCGRNHVTSMTVRTCKVRTVRLSPTRLRCTLLSQDVATVLHGCPTLRELDLQGNPVCHEPKYRDKLIMITQELCALRLAARRPLAAAPPNTIRTAAMLDGKPIDPQQRSFLLRFAAHKRRRFAVHVRPATRPRLLTRTTRAESVAARR